MLALTGLGVLIFFLWVVASTIQTDNVPESCYLRPYSDVSGPVYVLYGKVEWWNDSVLGHYPTAEEARKAADEMNCPIK
jgi:hypothetical protein